MFRVLALETLGFSVPGFWGGDSCHTLGCIRAIWGIISRQVS